MRLFGFAICVSLGLMALMACSEDNGVGNGAGAGPIRVTETKTMPMTIISENRAAVAFEVCREGVFQTRIDTNSYAIANGKLLLWAKEDCLADVFEGTSSTLVGRWTSTDKLEQIPGGADPSCSENTAEELVYPSVSGEIVMTENSITMTGSMDVCYSELSVDPEDSRFKTIGCDKVEWTQNGKTATVQYSNLSNLFNDEFTVTFSYAGKVCVGKNPAQLEANAETCAAAWSRFKASGRSADEWNEEDFTENPLKDSALEEYYSCIEKTGFLTSNDAAKRMLLPRIKRK